MDCVKLRQLCKCGKPITDQKTGKGARFRECKKCRDWNAATKATRKIQQCPTCGRFRKADSRRHCSQSCLQKATAKARKPRSKGLPYSTLDASRPGKASREVLYCAHCGSAAIVSDQRRALAKRRGVFYCDIECCNEHKKARYQSEGYQAVAYRAGLDPIDRMIRADRQAIVDRALQKGWQCCICCGKAYEGRSRKSCSACYPSLNAMRARLGYTPVNNPTLLECHCCGGNFVATQTVSTRKYCSYRCQRRQQRRLRDMRKRCNGPIDVGVTLAKVAAKSKWRCVDCGVRCIMPNGSNAPEEATLDHIHPLAHGGAHTWSNVELLCRQCNTIKGDLPMLVGFEDNPGIE